MKPIQDRNDLHPYFVREESQSIPNSRSRQRMVGISEPTQSYRGIRRLKNKDFTLSVFVVGI